MVWTPKSSVAWLNLSHNPRKLLTSLNGIVFSVVLMFMFTGFKNALYDSQLIFLQKLHGELFLKSTRRPSFAQGEFFPRRVLYQVQSTPEVSQAYPLYLGYAFWKNPETLEPLLVQIIAFNPSAPILDFPAIAANRSQLQAPGTALVDVRSLASIGPREAGITTELDNRKVDIVGTFNLGTNFSSFNGNLIMSDQNLLRFFTNREPKQGDRNLGGVDIGIVQLTPGSDPQQMAERLAQQLPSDIAIMTKAELIEWERKYWQESTNIGFIFDILTFMGLIVGIVLVYQVLYADITNNWSEYATLKAIGYKNSYLLRVILEEAVLLSLLGFLPGLMISSILFNLTGGATGLIFNLTLSRTLQMYFSTLTMAIISGMIAVLRVQQADPAEVF